MNNSMEFSFKINDEEMEKLKKILTSGRVRHYLNGEELDVVEYKEYQKLEKENQELKEKLNCDLKWAFKYDELYQENKKLKEQQKEFIEYLEEPIRIIKQGDLINISEYTSAKLDTLEEVLLKYKEIIGEEE